jgi:hypothetical protein
MIKIDNWNIERTRLHGHVSDHPRLGAGAVITSRIVKIDKRIVYTYSGSIYKLGKIKPNFKKLLKKFNSGWDWRKPLEHLVIEEELCEILDRRDRQKEEES